MSNNLLFLLFLLIIISSCSRNIYTYSTKDTIETIEFHDADHFIYKSKSGKERLRASGSYRIVDSLLFLKFRPIKQQSSILLFNEVDILTQKITTRAIGDSLILDLEAQIRLILSQNFFDPAAFMDVIFRKNKEVVHQTRTDGNGKLYLKLLDEFDEMIITYVGHDFLPVTIPVKGELNHQLVLHLQIDFLKRNMGAVGCGGRNEGPVKRMIVDFQNGQLVSIHSDNLNNKRFVREKK